MFRYTHVHLANYRCFEDLHLDLEPDITVIFAENGGGKTALLAALAMGLAVFQRGAPKALKPSPASDVRQIPEGERGRRVPSGACTLNWTAEVGGTGKTSWSTTIRHGSARGDVDHTAILQAIEGTRLPGQRWPLFAWYGVNRLWRDQDQRWAPRHTGDRWDGYASSLNPRPSDGSLLKWFTEEILSDAVRRREGEPERFLDRVVAETMVKATPGVDAIWYEPRERAPTVRFDDGHIALWNELSDGYHLFLALVADIARRSVTLNADVDGGDAPARIEGVVLIDEIDLHLHPRWQRVVLGHLREIFPRLQFVVSTHSPQVLSSTLNRQVRRLANGHLQERSVFVEGRDTNAILRDLMLTDDRDEAGRSALRDLHDAIDQGRRDEAEARFATLAARWGDLDPALIRARGLMDWEA